MQGAATDEKTIINSRKTAATLGEQQPPPTAQAATAARPAVQWARRNWRRRRHRAGVSLAHDRHGSAPERSTCQRCGPQSPGRGREHWQSTVGRWVSPELYYICVSRLRGVFEPMIVGSNMHTQGTVGVSCNSGERTSANALPTAAADGRGGSWRRCSRPGSCAARTSI